MSFKTRDLEIDDEPEPPVQRKIEPEPKPKPERDRRRLTEMYGGGNAEGSQLSAIFQQAVKMEKRLANIHRFEQSKPAEPAPSSSQPSRSSVIRQSEEWEPDRLLRIGDIAGRVLGVLNGEHLDQIPRRSPRERRRLTEQYNKAHSSELSGIVKQADMLVLKFKGILHNEPAAGSSQSASVQGRRRASIEDEGDRTQRIYLAACSVQRTLEALAPHRGAIKSRGLDSELLMEASNHLSLEGSYDRNYYQKILADTLKLASRLHEITEPGPGDVPEPDLASADRRRARVSTMVLDDGQGAACRANPQRVFTAIQGVRQRLKQAHGSEVGEVKRLAPETPREQIVYEI